jgi:hypothetical protein
MAMYDPAARRQGVRKGRERGCWVYIPAEELGKLRGAPFEAAPHYRTTGRAGGRTVIVEIWREP